MAVSENDCAFGGKPDSSYGMDFEERLQRMVERHEALAQSLERLTADVRQQGENIDKLTVETAAQQQIVTSVLTAMQQLIGVVTEHERRIGRLERM